MLLQNNTHSSLKSKVDLPDVQKTIGEIVLSLDQKVAHDDLTRLLKEKIDRSSIDDYLANKVSFEDLNKLINSKLNR